MSALSNLHVVLVRAENPINMGQVARAMKNFGLSNLLLVRCGAHRVPEAYTPGWKGKKILDSAKTFRDLSKITQKSSLAVGFTTRAGKDRAEIRPITQVVPQILEMLQKHKVHLVFGNEKNGLSNAELKNCHVVATIPANPEYSSLNLSHAVVIALSQIFFHTSDSHLMFKKPERFYATQKEFEILMKSFREALKLLGYQKSLEGELLENAHQNIRRYFRRTALEKREYHLFQAFLSRLKQKRKI